MARYKKVKEKAEEIDEVIMKEYNIPSKHEINSGHCCEFASAMLEAFPEAIYYSPDVSSKYGGHEFVKINGRYYDAEATGGVKRISELPIYSHLKKDKMKP